MSACQCVFGKLLDHLKTNHAAFAMGRDSMHAAATRVVAAG
jgi:hypothetical protein